MNHYSVDIRCSKCRAYLFSTFSAEECGKDYLCEACGIKKKKKKEEKSKYNKKLINKD